MQIKRTLKVKILSMALAAAMALSLTPAAAFAAESGNIPGASAVGTVQSFEKLEDRFIPSTGEGASKDVYALNVELNTPFEDLNLPDELTAMVARTTTVSAPAEDEPVVDSGKPSAPAEDEIIPDKDKVVDEDTDDTVSGNQPASPSDAEEEVKEEIKDEDVPLAPEPEDEEPVVTTTEQEIISVTWQSGKEYVSDENGQFIYTAELPEGYILADGVKLPQIYVLVGMQTRDTRADAITINVNTGTVKSGATLQAAVEANGGTANGVNSLKVTAGEVTTADWNYLKELNAMTDFEIANTIANDKVAGIPDVPENQEDPIFPLSIETVTVPQAISIGWFAFAYCTALTSASFPAATSIADDAFNGCTGLTSANFSAAETIGVNTFNDCSELTNLDFSAATTIGENAFTGCAALTSANFPAAITIGNTAFYKCTALTSASFPKVTNIGVNVFNGCTKLETLKLGATPPSVGTSAFKDCPATRALGYVDADGNDLAGDALTNAQAAYKAAADGNTNDDLWYGWTITSATTGGLAHDITTASLTMEAASGGTGCKSNCTDSTPHVVTGSTTSNNIDVTGGTHYVMLNNMSIASAAEDFCAFDVASGATVYLKLQLGTTNTLTSGDNCAGLQVPDGATLSISGGGKLTATGGLFSAGIGGSFANGGSAVDGGVISVNGGTVIAIGGGQAAGIGGGGNDGAGGTITINGGTVTATGGDNGAGIGGGSGGTGGTILITDGTVTAAGGDKGAGIGGGNKGSDGGTITINGGTVTATGGSAGAGIGGGEGDSGGGEGAGGTILITAGTVNATGGSSGAGIGGGNNGAGGTITITGGTVTAAGGLFGAGIGGGYRNSSGGIISITGGTVTATAKSNGIAAAVGRGDGGQPADTLTLTGMTAKYKTSGAYTGATNVYNNMIFEGTTHTTEAKDVKLLRTATQAGNVSSTPVSKTSTQVVIAAVTPPEGEAIEYAYSTSTTAPTTGWQDSTTFTGLTAGTTYYFFARIKANDKHYEGAASTGTAIATEANSSTITPTTAAFDKYTSATGYADVAVTQTPSGNTLNAIKNGSAALTSGTEYTVSGNTITIKKEYLAQQATGTTTLTFDYSAGTDPTLAITVSDSTPGNSTITPTTATFDKYTSATGYADVAVTQTPSGNTLNAIKNGSAALTSGTEYTVSGNTITIKKEYLAQQATGTTTLTFDYSAGTDPTLAIIVSDSTPGGADKTSLIAAIANAKSIMSNTVISIQNGADVSTSTYWVSPGIMSAAKAALSEAEAILANPNATQAEIDNAVVKLNAKVNIDFKNAKKLGTKSSDGGGGSGLSSSSGSSGDGGGFTSAPSSATSGTLNAAESSKGAANVSSAIKNALATGSDGKVSASAAFKNYSYLSVDGLKAINSVAKKEAKGKAVSFKINLDKVEKGAVVSRIAVDPAALAAELSAKKIPGNLPLGVSFDQKSTKVSLVNARLNKHFSNKVISVVYDQKSPLNVNADFCAKLNLKSAFGQDRELYFYSYDNVKNTFTRIAEPNYRVDKNGYAYISAPFGGSIVISDEPLTKK